MALDSLAGQMSAMRGGAPVKKRRVKTDDSSDEEDESDTEGEVDGVSDTDTDTEDEA